MGHRVGNSYQEHGMVQMRQAFINTLIQLAETNKDIWLLTADMGFGLVEPFAEKFPERFINVGVAEQNMIGIATGLALGGKKVFCYSIANFPTMRCLEQIRNDVCCHNLPVCIVSGGAGLWYGALGMTHHAVEDIAVMRCLPNMAVVSPADATEIKLVVKAVVDIGQPCYLRMSRTSDLTLPIRGYQFGKITPRMIGSAAEASVSIIATGGQMIANALLATALLRRKGLRTKVLNAHTLKPLDRDTVVDTLCNSEVVVTVEEHSRIGGLGSAVAEVASAMVRHAPLRRLGTADYYPTKAMSYEELLEANHLDVDSIVKEVLDVAK